MGYQVGGGAITEHGKGVGGGGGREERRTGLTELQRLRLGGKISQSNHNPHPTLSLSCVIIGVVGIDNK